MRLTAVIVYGLGPPKLTFWDTKFFIQEVAPRMGSQSEGLRLKQVTPLYGNGSIMVKDRTTVLG